MKERLRIPVVPDLVQAAGRRYGERILLVAPDGEESFADLAREMDQAADWLEQSGVRPANRVLLQSVNTRELVHAWLGCMRLGALPAAVNPRLTAHELRFLVDDLEPVIVLTDQGRADEALKALRHRALPVAGLDWDAPAGRLGEGGANGVRRPVDSEVRNPAAIVYTSGTTSRPKGVLVTHQAYVLTGEAFPSWVGLGPKERIWACMPLFHINAQAYSLMTALCHGYSLALSDSFHASSFWRDAKRFGATTTNLVGAMLAILARQPAEAWCDTKLHTIYAAPALTVTMRRALELRFRVRLVTGYGLTESPFGCIESPTSRNKENGVGHPRQHPSRRFTNELRVMTDDGSVAASGLAGELCFRNPTVTPGYWRAPEITSRVLKHGWVQTGDLGYVDDDGDVILIGRRKEMIRRRGENIAPSEIEDVLLMHPEVRAAAAVGVPSDLSEEDVVAWVALVEDNRLDEIKLQLWCSQYLADFKVPSRIVIRDSLPMTPTMRIAKDALRAEFAQGSGRADND